MQRTTMLDIFLLLSPVFLVMLAGYLAVARDWLSTDHVKALGQFVIKIALPSLLLVNLSSLDIEELWHPEYLISYGLATLIPFLSVLCLYRHLFKEPLNIAGLFAMGSCMSNTGFIGTAILTLLIGPEAAVYFAMTFILENLVGFLLFMICVELHHSQRHTLWQATLQSVRNIVQNPIIIALSIGVLCSIMTWHPPQIIQQSLTLLAQTSAGLGLFVIGASLYGLQGQCHRHHYRDLIIIGGTKLAIMPLLVFAFFQFFPQASDEMIFAGVLLAGISMASLFGIFGHHLSVAKRSSPILLLTTLLSLFSLSLIIHLLKP